MIESDCPEAKQGCCPEKEHQESRTPEEPAVPPGPAPLHIVKVKAQPHEKDGQRKKVNSIRRQTGGQASTQHPGASEGQELLTQICPEGLILGTGPH